MHNWEGSSLSLSRLQGKRCTMRASVIARGGFEWRRGASASMECAFRNACALIQLIEHKSLIGRNSLKQTGSLTSLSHTLRQVLVISCFPAICQFSDKRNTVYSLNLEWTSSSFKCHFVTIYLKLNLLWHGFEEKLSRLRLAQYEDWIKLIENHWRWLSPQESPLCCNQLKGSGFQQTALSFLHSWSN